MALKHYLERKEKRTGKFKMEETVTIKYTKQEIEDQITSKKLVCNFLSELPNDLSGLNNRLKRLVEDERKILDQLNAKRLDDFNSTVKDLPSNAPSELAYQEQQEQCKSGVCD